MKNLVISLLFTVVAVIQGYGQAEVYVDYNLVKHSSNQIILEVLVWDATPSTPTRLFAMTTALNTSKGIVTDRTPLWIESNAFARLYNPSVSITDKCIKLAPNGQIRATQIPAGNAAQSILLSSKPTHYATIIINSVNPINFPLTLTANGNPGSGIASLQATKYDEENNGEWSGVSTITYNAGQIVWKERSLTIERPMLVGIIDNNTYVEGGINKVLRPEKANSFVAFPYKNSDYSDIIINFYPNPTTHTINVDLSGMDLESGDINLTVYDNSARQVLSKKIIGNGIELIDVSNLPAGTYNVLVQQGDIRFQKSIIKIN